MPVNRPEKSGVPRVLAVIPARGGSKGVPKKNITNLGGKPLIAYTLLAARNSRYLSRTVVSTDCEEIAEVAKQWEGEVPFLRPADLATDGALSLPVIQHAVQFCEADTKTAYDYVVMLQPTSPFRTGADIDACISMLCETGADSAISVVDVGANHPLRMKRIVGKDHLVNYVDQGHEDMRPRQSLPRVYIRNGAVYAVRRNVLCHENSFVGEDCRGFIMPKDRSINIDTAEDLIFAEYFFKKIAPE